MSSAWEVSVVECLEERLGRGMLTRLHHNDRVDLTNNDRFNRGHTTETKSLIRRTTLLTLTMLTLTKHSTT